MGNSAQARQAKKQGYHHGDLKRALLDETARLLREEGEEALSLRRLAANIGVSRTAPYNHFANKESLLCAVAEEGFERFNAAMKQARHQARDLPGRAAMLADVRAYVAFATQHREYYDLMYGSKPWGTGNPTASLSASARGTLRRDVERLRRGQDAGVFAAGVDMLRFAHVYWGTLHGISRLLLDGVFTDASSLDRVCEEAADMLWARLDPARN
ncbi:MAG: TetR family transcriptional regulator [Halioglobus sp.]|nr:TetR family transcriptional regulator [Halioglobus sp.]